MLEALAEAQPTDEEAGNADAVIEGNDTKALANAVTWDIDVETYNSHHRVQWYLDFFLGPGRERMGIWLNRMQRYEPMIRERLAREGMPGDLVYLALIESGFSNTATSRAKAVGMWQFMKGTAKYYDLRVDSWVDERRDPFLATDAAARHLRDLNARFGSLYLAAAAYNAGSGRVSRGLRRLRDDDSDRTSDAAFFRLYDTRLLRRETKDYVPKLIAAAVIAKEPARYGFTVTPAEPLVYDSIVVPDDDRPRRDRPAGRHHRRGDPRAQPAVPPPGDAARQGVGRPPARRARARDRRGVRGAAAGEAGDVRRALRGARGDDGRDRAEVPGQQPAPRRREPQGEPAPAPDRAAAHRAHRRSHLQLDGAPDVRSGARRRHQLLGIPPGQAG